MQIETFDPGSTEAGAFNSGYAYAKKRWQEYEQALREAGPLTEAQENILFAWNVGFPLD